MSFTHYKVIKLYTLSHEKREKKMANTLKFVYVTILFTSLFLFAKNVVGEFLFFVFFKFSYLLCCLYTIFYLVLLTLFYSLLSLQGILIAKLMMIVQNLNQEW